MSARKTLVLLDSHAIIHRAYHALPDFSSSKGVPTGALYGLTTMLLGILEKFKPEYIVACYDLPEPTYRHLAYDAYKAGRKKTDDALVTQLESSRKIFEALGIPIFDKPGFEADDMLGTIVEQIVSKFNLKDESGIPVKTVIASGDMDTMQLVVGDDVVVYTLKKGIKDIVVYDELAVIERFGFAPKYLPDYKGLRGDPSDNIIGISGIGEKTASVIISTFKTIEDMYLCLDSNPQEFKERLKGAKITDRIIDLLDKGRDDALFSKALATIRRDAPIEFDFKDAIYNPDLNKVESLFKELEFRNLFTRVKDVFNTDKSKSGSISSVNSSDSIDSGRVREDVDPYVSASDEMKEKLKVALWVTNSNYTNPSLKDVYMETGEIDPELAFGILWKKAHEIDQGFVLDTIELPLIPMIFEMKKIGTKIDVAYLDILAKEYHQTLNKLETEIHVLAGKEFNVASPKQLGSVLYDDLGLGGSGSGTRIKKTAGGARSTKESELEKLVDAHPIIPKIMEYRELAKLLGTYIDVFPTLVDEEQRIHATFTQTGAMTGRMSSQDPNLQNIPIKSELGRKIRNAFIAPPGRLLVSLDYSQIELRLAAILSGDQQLIEIFKNGTDVHTGVAARVFKVEEKDVTKDMRRQAKVINFGILYGMGVTALRQNLSQGGYKIDRAEAQKFYDDYFQTFSGLAEYLNNTKTSATKLGYTETIFGRRRYFEGLKSKLPFIQAASLRMAINAPIQGTSADITKLAMSAVQEICNKKNDAHLIMQIHDELIYEVNEGMAEDIAKQIQSEMEQVFSRAFDLFYQQKGMHLEQLDVFKKRITEVPIKVSFSIGKNWGDMK